MILWNSAQKFAFLLFLHICFIASKISTNSEKKGSLCRTKAGYFIMEFKVFQKELELQSRGWIPTFHDVSKEIIEIVQASGVKNGTVCIASHHTTCSVMIQECSHDIDSFDIEYLQHDLLDIMQQNDSRFRRGTSVPPSWPDSCPIWQICKRAW